VDAKRFIIIAPADGMTTSLSEMLDAVPGVTVIHRDPPDVAVVEMDAASHQELQHRFPMLHVEPDSLYRPAG
jgi:hypothetical protein